MKELETLLNRRWILKSEDRELYYKIRDSIGEIRKFATEKSLPQKRWDVR